MSCQSRFVFGVLTLLAAACGGATDASEDVSGTQDEIRVTSSFAAKGTGYYPSSSQLEGGFNDRIGKKLHTLQQFLDGDADYASVAMDSTAFKYGTRLRIREVDSKYGRSVVFRVVDTGGAFSGKGRSRIDICVANRTASVEPTINGTLHIEVIDETGSATATASGKACSNDGACNPGNEGSGEICSSGQCVSGCHSSAQCPGSKSCQAGQCR